MTVYFPPSWDMITCLEWATDRPQLWRASEEWVMQGSILGVWNPHESR